MDLSDDEDFYDSDHSDVGEQSLHTMLKKNLYEVDNEYHNYEEQIPNEEELLGSIEEEVLGKVTDNGDQEIVHSPVNSKKIDPDSNEKLIDTNATIIAKKLDEAKNVILDPEVIEELEKKHLFDELDNDNFVPLKKKQKLNDKDSIEDNPHKTIIMHVPQYIRCNNGGQSIQVQ